MSLVEHAEQELRKAGFFDEDSDYDGRLGPAVLDIVKKFADQGHSGFSAAITTQLVEKLMRYEPLTPLTGEDDEWLEIADQNGETFYQNRRFGRVFKEGDRAYDVEAVVFREPSGCCYTSRDSFRDITFPYLPTTEIVDVPAEERE